MSTFGKVRVGDASNGLCGGMVFTVLDVFTAGLPPLQDGRPSAHTPLYSYIVARLVDSFDVPNGVLKYFDWMLEPDGDIDLWLTSRRGVLPRAIMEQAGPRSEPTSTAVIRRRSAS